MPNQIPYKNPFSILEDYIDLSNLDNINLDQIKKQLILELQLSKDQFIHIKKEPYSKQDIIDLFNQLELENYQFHLWVWKNKPLQVFLEDGIISDDFTLEKYATYFDADFKELELLLANAINKYSRQQIRTHKFKQLADLINVSRFSNFESKRIAYRRIESLFNNFILQARSYQGIQTKSQAKQFQYIRIPSINKLANALPEEYQSLRESYALAVVNFTYKFQKTDARFCRDVLTYAQHIDCSEETKKLLINNYRSFNNISNVALSDKPVNKRFLIAGLTVLVFICINLIRTCATKEHTYKRRKPIPERAKSKPFDSRDIFTEYHSFLKKELTKTTFFTANHPSIKSKFIRYNIDIDPKERMCSFRFNNNLDYDAVICTYDALQIRHYYVESKDSVDLYANNSLSYFAYIGKDWDSSNKITTVIKGRMYGINGVFKTHSKEAQTFINNYYNTSGSKTKTKRIEFSSHFSNEIKKSESFINE